MKNIKLTRTSRRGYKVGNMFLTQKMAKEVETETNEILNSLK